MSVLDRIRIENAVQRYDLALDLHGVRSPRRRELRRELRANLRESATRAGAGHALAGIGSPEVLARESAAAFHDPRRPAWSQGLCWAMAAVAAYWLAALWTAFAFMDGVFAARATHEVRGHPTLMPGVEIWARQDAEGISGGLLLQGGFWLASLGLFLLVLALAGRLWRPLCRATT